MKRVFVEAYDDSWPQKFVTSSEEIASAMEGNFVAIHHIGSTSIAGIYAKPIIDMLVVANDLTFVDQQSERMTALGYEGLGEFGIPGRRYFRRDDASGQRTEQVHVFERDSPHILRHLAFRDFLRETPEFAAKYSDLKRTLAEAHASDINAYMDGKDGFIKDVEARALAWMKGLRIRTAARLVLFDRAGRILLLLHTDVNDREHWAMPGGGVEPGETLRQAATREAREELGLDAGKLEHLWSGHTHFVFGDREVVQSEAFFLVADHCEVSLSPAIEETHRREGIIEMRWWDVRDLERTTELVFPSDLAARIAGLRRRLVP